MQRKTQPTKNKAKVIRINTDSMTPAAPAPVYMVEMLAPYATKWVTVKYRPHDKSYSKGKLWIPVPPGTKIRSSTKAKVKAKAPAKVVQPKPVAPQQQSSSSVSSSRLSLKEELAQRLAVERQHAAARRREERNSLKYQ